MTEAASRRSRIVEANIIGVHAYQVILRGRSGKGDVEAFGDAGLSAEALDALVKAHQRLAQSDPAEVAKWVAGEPTRFDPADALEPLLNSGLKLADNLPVNVVTRAMREQAPEVDAQKARAFANLVQVTLESDRDGDILQDMMKLYLPLGLLVGPADFGIADDNKAFYEFASRLTPECCEGPFGTRRSSFQIVFRKVHNWSLKNRGVGPKEYAAEVLARDDIKPLIPKIKAMPAQRILVLGHSFTMQVNWATLAPMNVIAEEVFRELNPGVVWGHMGHGGMRAWQARDKFLDKALEWKPDKVLMVVAVREDRDYEALEEMSRRFKEIGAQTVLFDSIYVKGADELVNADTQRLRDLADRTGIALIPVAGKLATHPDRADFICLDNIHMRGSYHKFMAAELLKFLVEANSR